jgi:hypothetical protein
VTNLLSFRNGVVLDQVMTQEQALLSREKSSIPSAALCLDRSRRGIAP